MTNACLGWLPMLGCLLWASAQAATSVAPLPFDECNAPGFQTVLRASPDTSAVPANAYWLNRHLIQWPGVVAPSNFRLYHSAAGQIVAATGAQVMGADGVLALSVFKSDVPASLALRLKFVANGLVLSIAKWDVQQLQTLHRQQLVLVQEDAAGRVLKATAIQSAGALDDLYAAAARVNDLGVSMRPSGTSIKLWAPTAQRVSVCFYSGGSSLATAHSAMQFEASTGIWQAHQASDMSGQYYRFVVDVVVPGVGLVRNRVTDPYAISLTADSARSYIADLAAPNLKPAGWDDQPVVEKVKAPSDMVVYELHVRDFSVNDSTVSSAYRGKYKAFTQSESNGMKHLRALSNAGVTDVHLLPIFDIATIPESGCVTPLVAPGLADGESQQASVMALAGKDCFNWGYDPFHFNAPEGSYATDAADGAVRVRELRDMVMALHAAGLRVGMDVVYNHMAASGQHEKSVLDRIVPGYYHRLNADGAVERSTCCDNTATENLMMSKLMTDSVVLWATQYRMDSFRFDLMAHQPRAVMEGLQARVDKATGRHVNLIGEGWNFGEVENGRRFVQASQLSLNGSGIGTFSDRGRDAVRGGSAMDSGVDLLKHQGYINGLFYAPNAVSQGLDTQQDLARSADLVRVGLAGSIRGVRLNTYSGVSQTLADIDYAGQPAGYVSQPSEVVNYVENHDNQTLFDINVYKLPLDTSREDRVRVQMLGAAINMFSQGIAYFHAGIEALRSKSMDGNSYDSGDWFNRIDWSFQDNYFGTGLPPKGDNERNYAHIKPLLNNPNIKPAPKDMALTRDMFFDLLKIRASTTLLRLRSAQDIKDRLSFYNTGPQQEPSVLAVHLDGQDYPGAVFKELIYFVNVDTRAHDLTLNPEHGKPYQLHPVHLADAAADKRVASLAAYDKLTGRFTVPARTALVYVVQPEADTSSVLVGNSASALPSTWRDGVFMEVFVRSYQDSDGDGIGDIKGLMQKLDYLKVLGVTGLWLMPVNPSQDKDHGYAVTDYRDIAPEYGTLADFDELLKQAHQRGIGIIMDYVINHSAAQHPAFDNAAHARDNAYRDWYVWQDVAPAGWRIYGSNPWRNALTGYYFAGFSEQMPDFNLRNSAVVHWHQDNLRFWLNRGVDGFRFDAVGNLIENGANAWEAQAENHAVMAGVQATLAPYANRFMVCEAPAAPQRFAQPDSCGSAFAFGYQYDLISAVKGDVNAVESTAGYWRTAPAGMVGFASNHDAFAGQRLYDQFTGNSNQMRLAAATYLLQTRSPFIYYGEEIGMAGAFGLGGDRKLRTPMSWTADPVGAGFTTGTPFRQLSSNVAQANVAFEDADADSLLNFYRSVIALRQARPSLQRGSYQGASASGALMTFARTLGDEKTIVVFNYGSNSGSLTLNGLTPGATLHRLWPAGGADLTTNSAGSVAVSQESQSFTVFGVDL